MKITYINDKFRINNINLDTNRCSIRRCISTTQRSKVLKIWLRLFCRLSKRLHRGNFFVKSLRSKQLCFSYIEFILSYFLIVKKKVYAVQLLCCYVEILKDSNIPIGGWTEIMKKVSSCYTITNGSKNVLKLR